jgi:hypothetical protein
LVVVAAAAATVAAGPLTPVGAAPNPRANKARPIELPVSASQNGPWTVGVNALPPVTIAGTPTVQVSNFPTPPAPPAVQPVSGTVTTQSHDVTSLLWEGDICGDPAAGGNYGSPTIDVSGVRTVRIAMTAITFLGANTIDVDTADIAPFIVLDQLTVNDDFTRTYEVLGRAISLFCEVGHSPSAYHAAVWGRP